MGEWKKKLGQCVIREKGEAGIRNGCKEEIVEWVGEGLNGRNTRSGVKY